MKWCQIVAPPSLRDAVELVAGNLETVVTDKSVSHAAIAIAVVIVVVAATATAVDVAVASLPVLVTTSLSMERAV